MENIVPNNTILNNTSNNQSDKKGVVQADWFNHADVDQHRPIVFTNGCFDILHRGHADYLQRAAQLGKTLVVGVNDDDSVQRLQKGPGRPFNPLQDRMELLAALRCVDYVVPFTEDTPLNLIKIIRPDHLVKGGDWSVEKIVGADFVQSQGGKVHSLAVQFDRSTTTLVQRIQKRLE